MKPKIIMPKLKLSQRFTDHFIQAVLIFASIFVAFWLTDVRERQNSDRVVKLALENIASELTYNHNRIESSFGYYLKIIAQLDSLEKYHPEKLKTMYGHQLKGWRGVQLPMLQSSAYQTILNSGIIKDMPFEIVKSLSYIYHVQSVIERLDNAFIEDAVSDRGISSLNKVKHLFNLFTDILPDVMAGYQQQGKKYLEQYGYKNDLAEGTLKIIVEQRIKK